MVNGLDAKINKAIDRRDPDAPGQATVNKAINGRGPDTPDQATANKAINRRGPDTLDQATANKAINGNYFGKMRSAGIRTSMINIYRSYDNKNKLIITK